MAGPLVARHLFQCELFPTQTTLLRTEIHIFNMITVPTLQLSAIA